MEIKVHVKLRSSKVEVIKMSQTEYAVRLTAPPEKGKANEQLIDAISEFLKVPRRKISIVRGAASREKTLEIAP